MATDDLTSTLTLSTDQTDYAPGSTATFMVDGVTAGDTYDFVVVDTAGNPVSGTNLPWEVVASADGTLTTTWAVGQDALGEAFQVTVVDETTLQSATVNFTDSLTTLDFTAGLNQSDKTANNAIFSNTNLVSKVGTGIVQSFLTIQGSPTEQGYNTDGTPLPLNDQRPAFTNAVALSQLALVHADGTPFHTGDSGPAYRMFLLDLNESTNKSKISLDALQVWQANSGTLTDFDPPSAQGGSGTGLTADGGHLVYNLDAGGDKTILLDASFTAGSGHGAHLAVLIPDSSFDAQQFVYLYSAFGYQPGYTSDGGFEEWFFLKAPQTNTVVTAAAPTIEKDVVVDVFGPGNVDTGVQQTFDANDSSTSASDPERAPIVLAGHHVTLEVTIGNLADPQTGANIVNGNVTDNPASLVFNFGTNFTLANGSSTSATIDIDTTHLSGLQSDTAHFTGSYTDGNGTHTFDVSDPANFFVATAGISVDKQLTSNAQPYVEVGAGLPSNPPVVLVGKTVNFQAVITNQSTGGLGVTGLTLSDVNSPNSVTPPSFSGNSTSLAGNGGSTTATASLSASAGLQTDTLTVTGTVTDEFGYATTVMASDQAVYYGATPGITVEKLVSVNGGLDWYFLADDANDTIANISALTGISASHLHIGTPSTLSGASVQYEIVVQNTTDGGLTETVQTVSDSTGLVFSLGTSNLDVNGQPGDHELSNTATTTAGTGNAIPNTVTVSGQVTDSFGNQGTATDSDTATYNGLGHTLSGLTKGFWSQHLQIWDASTSDDNTWAGKLNGVIAQNSDINPSPAADWNHDGSVNSKDAGLLLGDLNHDGLANDGVGQDLFFDLASAQALINSGSSTPDERQILASQALAAQLNEYNDYIYDKAHHGGNPPAAGFDASPTGLIEDAVQWLLGQGPFSPHTNTTPGHSNVDTVTSNDFIAPSVIGSDYSISNKGVITLGTGNGGIVLSNSSDPSWHTFATINDSSNNAITFTDLLVGDSHYGQTFNVQADGEGLKNALQAYNQGQLVVSDDGAKIGWSDDGGTTVNDVHDNTAGAFWGILEDQNLAHGATTIVGVHAV